MVVGALADAATLRMLSIRAILSPPSLRRAGHGLGRDIALACRGMVTAPALTLAIVAIYGLLFALGWLVLYFGVYLPRGGVQP